MQVTYTLADGLVLKATITDGITAACLMNGDHRIAETTTRRKPCDPHSPAVALATVMARLFAMTFHGRPSLYRHLEAVVPNMVPTTYRTMLQQLAEEVTHRRKH